MEAPTRRAGRGRLTPHLYETAVCTHKHPSWRDELPAPYQYHLDLDVDLTLMVMHQYGQYEAVFNLKHHLPTLRPGLEFGDVFLE